MTKIYFVRHAQPEHAWEDDRTRPLTDEGKADSFDMDIIIDARLREVNWLQSRNIVMWRRNLRVNRRRIRGNMAESIGGTAWKKQ